MQSAAKSRADDGELLHPIARQRLDRLVRIRLDPLGAAEARLEGELELGADWAERRAQGVDRVHALALVRIALVDIVLRQPVERGENRLGLEVEAGEMRS